MAKPTNDGLFDQRAASFQSDTPFLSEAMKSYLTIQMAQELTRVPEVTHMRNGKNLGTTNPSSYSNTTQEELLCCARVILKHINTYQIPSESEWALQFPQREDEGGLDRIESVTDFRVARALSAHVTKSGGKLTKFFGQRYLKATHCWTKELQDIIRADLIGQRIDEVGVDAFLDGWAKAVSGEDKDISELVWSKNFNAALATRRLEREKEIKERTERLTKLEEGGDSMEAVKSMLQGSASEPPIEVPIENEPLQDDSLSNFSFSNGPTMADSNPKSKN
mmetsp:Transcript_3851/g.5084  ORF Transcript_3851/g.5084 Transcript_3851/m.5084 type:complete len:279 (-) Transcript_3851:139-975(-)